MRRRAQEPQITSKVAWEIERRLDGDAVTRFRVSAVAQDFTDRGPGSDEWHSGADLYIGIQINHDDGESLAKGMLIQAKKTRTDLFRQRDRTLLGHVVSEQAALVKQCEKMLRRTKPNGAFVWLYGAAGTDVVPAQEVINNAKMPPELLGRRNVAEHFRDVLDCFQGDPNLAGKGVFDSDEELGIFMEEIAVQRGVALKLVPIER
jgi:hypothetical protein